MDEIIKALGVLGSLDLRFDELRSRFTEAVGYGDFEIKVQTSVGITVKLNWSGVCTENVDHTLPDGIIVPYRVATNSGRWYCTYANPNPRAKNKWITEGLNLGEIRLLKNDIIAMLEAVPLLDAELVKIENSKK